MRTRLGRRLQVGRGGVKALRQRVGNRRARTRRGRLPDRPRLRLRDAQEGRLGWRRCDPRRQRARPVRDVFDASGDGAVRAGRRGRRGRGHRCLPLLLLRLGALPPEQLLVRVPVGAHVRRGTHLAECPRRGQPAVRGAECGHHRARRLDWGVRLGRLAADVGVLCAVGARGVGLQRRRPAGSVGGSLLGVAHRGGRTHRAVGHPPGQLRRHLHARDQLARHARGRHEVGRHRRGEAGGHRDRVLGLGAAREDLLVVLAAQAVLRVGADAHVALEGVGLLRGVAALLLPAAERGVHAGRRGAGEHGVVVVAEAARVRGADLRERLRARLGRGGEVGALGGEQLHHHNVLCAREERPQLDRASRGLGAAQRVGDVGHEHRGEWAEWRGERREVARGAVEDSAPRHRLGRQRRPRYALTHGHVVRRRALGGGVAG
eukprot:scaffold61250_cov65-Phaeocystis_antarctica.AAC.3